ncbi:MAG: type VI secretion system baseplate subunit TssG [Alphaproteobacteria bacterium]|nr:type VI secretion system baseplate subunit TssG [Alphaproteobacteria bacterium]
MAGTFRKPASSLVAALVRDPRRFAFFQVARLLERWRRRRPADGKLGETLKDPVRFRATPDLAFQGSEVREVEAPPQGPAGVQVGFMGVAGAGGALPPMYAELLMQTVRARSTALKGFLDLFNHRSLLLLFRAWSKYRLPIQLERSLAKGDDPPSRLVFALSGLGTEPLRGRLAVDDHLVGFFSGHFTRGPRPAEGLQSVLESLQGEPVEVRQFQGRWIRLEDADLTRLKTPRPSAPGHTRLGVDCVLGGRVWDVQGGVKLVIGPVSPKVFRQLLPDGERARIVVDTARLYAGLQASFVLQVIIAGGDAPDLRLDAAEPESPRLGWNTWLGRPHEGLVADAVFAPAPSQPRKAA